VTDNNATKLMAVKYGNTSFVKKEPKLIVYSKDKNELGMELEKMLEELVSKENEEICRTTPDLALRLRMPLRESSIVVLLISDEEDLKNMLSIQSLLINMRIVLILPDRNDGTIEAGHELHPRYLSFKDNGLKDLKAVLSRMIEVEKTTFGDTHKQRLSI
jgi:hypothetical protein